MITRRFVVALLFTVLVTVSVFALLQERIPPEITTQFEPTPTPSAELEIRRDFPTVAYVSEAPTSARRTERGKKYDRLRMLDPGITADEKETNFVDWIQGADVLPIAESELVVTGKVIGAEAFLSTGKKSVYSEFRIEIERVYRNKAKTTFEEGKYLDVERDGGVVAYPSGFKLWYFVAGQRMPRVGERCLFFLSHQFPMYGRQTQDLYLLTAFKLADGKSAPLDDIDIHPIFRKYNRVGESQLLKDVESAVKTMDESKAKEKPE